METILIVANDDALKRSLEETLQQNRYCVITAENGIAALELLEKEYVDFVISETAIAGVDGYELVRNLREQKRWMPILLIAKNRSLEELQAGFLAGADDSVGKPVDGNEIVLRVQALLRRVRMSNDYNRGIGETELCLDSFTVRTEGESVVLPQKEFMLLYKMISFPNRIFSRQQMMHEIWGYGEPGNTHTLDVHIARLRERFRNNKDFQIVTVRGEGYKVIRQ